MIEQENRGNGDRRQDNRRKEDADLPPGQVDRREDDRRQRKRRESSR